MPADSLHNLHVVKAVKASVVHGYGTRFRIIKYYSGSLFKDTVTVWGYAGSTCRLSLEKSWLPAGDTVFLIMTRITGIEGPEETYTDFSVDYCGSYYLQVKGDSVYGGIDTFAQNGYPIGAFTDSLCKVLPNHCITAGISSPQEAPRVTVYPNPAADRLFVKGTRPAKIKVTDVLGRTVAQCGPANSISLAAVPPGMYLVCLYSAGGNLYYRQRITKE